ncbi:hypothetical protein H6A66_12055 [Bacteroides caecigallinarum]|uniref:hypothetical protein n=1 Tax=Bacteroides caecigallinarum TaxID=1411144 RepID=UPI00195E98B4|nr:hypothetical protein [Bacteroides caecigallinarum]MBM6865899.1 hypothetical protein [Bacteroides caecigallinarum]
MRKIRIGKELEMRWALFDTENAPLDLSGKELTLFLITPVMSRIGLGFAVSGNIVSASFKGTEQRIPGMYGLTLWINKGKEGQNVVDCCKAFELVPWTCMEGGDSDSDIDVETVDLHSNFDIGISGESAYQIALRNGFEGTEEEWLQSLHGEPGKSFTYDDFTPEQIAGLQKPAKDAAALVEETNINIQKAEQLRQETFTRLSEEMTAAVNSIPVRLEILEDIND